MLEAAPYSWDDVPDPTEAELEEIDAAIAAAPQVEPTDRDKLDAWIESYPVKLTLNQVGWPDGSTTWMLRFTAQLFANTDAIAEALSDADPNRMLELATSWHNSLGRQGWSRGGATPLELLREMTERLPVEGVAQYLDASVEQVQDWLFPRTDTGALRTAGRLYGNGVSLRQAAERCGLDKNTVLRFVTAMRIEAPQIVTYADGRKTMPADVKQRVLELAERGLGSRAITDAILDERPDLSWLKRDTVWQYVHRSKRARVAA